jgi:mercuric ion binding protein
MVLKHLHGLLLASSVAGTMGCKNDSRSAETNASSTQADAREAVFHVDGMTCASCNVTVKVAAERVRGVRSARADAAQALAWVSFDPAATTPAQIAAAISETGYKTTAIEATDGEGTPKAEREGVPADVAARLPCHAAVTCFRVNRHRFNPMPRREKRDPLAEKIGRRIRHLRQAINITQEKLAYEGGLKSKGHLSGIENGLVLPTLPTLALLAGRLGVDLLDVLTFPEDSDRQQLVDLTRSMKQGTVRRLVRDAQP